MARPTKRTPETEKAILDALRAGATITAAIGAAGITDDTFANWRHRFSGFSDAVTRACASGRLWHELNLRQAAEGDWRASLEYLARRYPADWAKHDDLTVTIRQVAERYAAEQGLDVAEIMAEAERLVSRSGNGRPSLS